MRRLNLTWPQIPDGFVFPNSSKLPPAQAAVQAEIVTAACRRGYLLPRQRQMVLGTLLGGGYISPNGYYAVNHGLSQKEYLWTKYTVLSEFVYGQPSMSKKNKLGYESVRCWTAVVPELRCLRNLCYDPHGTKVVTTEWLEKIDLIGFRQCVAWWIADDGTRVGPPRSPNLFICTQGFSHPEVQLLCDWMGSHGYPATIYTAKRAGYRDYPMMQFSVEVSARLMHDVKLWTPPCMRYKLDLSARVETQACSFCNATYSLRETATQKYVKSAATPCCQHPDCRRKYNRMFYDRIKSDPARYAAHLAKRRAWSNTDAHRKYMREYSKQRRKDKPAIFEAARIKHHAKRRAAIAATTWCRMCGKPALDPTTNGRCDRKYCPTCYPEALRLKARRKHYQKMAQKRRGTDRTTYLKKVDEITALLTTFSSPSKTSASTTSAT